MELILSKKKEKKKGRERKKGWKKRKGGEKRTSLPKKRKKKSICIHNPSDDLTKHLLLKC